MANDDDELEQLKKEAEELGIDISSDSSYGSPTQEKKEGLFKFFKWVLQLKESWKVGNLLNSEIGQSKLSIRSNLELAQYSKAEKLDIVSEYFTERANIIASSSMGRKGFMPQLFVSQIKKEQKIKGPEPEKKKWFSGKTEEGQDVK